MTRFGVTAVPLPVFWSTSTKDRNQLKRRHQQPHFCQNPRCAANSAASSPPYKVDSPKRPRRSSSDVGQKNYCSNVLSTGTPTLSKISGGIVPQRRTNTEHCMGCNRPLGRRKSEFEPPRDMHVSDAFDRFAENYSNGSASQSSSRYYAPSVRTPTRYPTKPSAKTHAPLSARSRSSSIISSSPGRSLIQTDNVDTCLTYRCLHASNRSGPSQDCSQSPNFPASSSCPSDRTCTSVLNYSSISNCPPAPNCSPVPNFSDVPSSPRIPNLPPLAEYQFVRESQNPAETRITPAPKDPPIEKSRGGCDTKDRSTVSSPKVGKVAPLNSETDGEYRTDEDNHWRNVSTAQSCCELGAFASPVSPRRSVDRHFAVVGPSETSTSKRSPSFPMSCVTSGAMPPPDTSRSPRGATLTSLSSSKVSKVFKDHDYSNIPPKGPHSQSLQRKCAVSVQKEISHMAPSTRSTVSKATQMCVLERRVEDEEARSQSSDLIITCDDIPAKSCAPKVYTTFGKESSSAYQDVRHAPLTYNNKEELDIDASRHNSNKDRNFRVAMEIAVLIVMATVLVIVFYPIFIRATASHFYGCCSCPTDSAMTTAEGHTSCSQIRSNNIWVYSGVPNLLQCPLAQQAMGSTVLK